MDLERIQLEVGNVETRAAACLAGLVAHGDNESLLLVRILAQQLGLAVHELERQGERLATLEAEHSRRLQCKGTN